MQGLESRDLFGFRFTDSCLFRCGSLTSCITQVMQLHFKKLCIEPLTFCLSCGVFLRKTCVLDLKGSNHGEPITYPNKLFQSLITLTVKNLYLISNLNISGVRFQPLDLVMPLRAQLKNAKASDTISICQCFNTETSVADSHEVFGRIRTTSSNFSVCLQSWLGSHVKMVNAIDW